MRGSANGLESGEKRERAKGARGAPAVVPQKIRTLVVTGESGPKETPRATGENREEREIPEKSRS